MRNTFRTLNCLPVCALLLLSFASPLRPQASAEADIRQVLSLQVDAWNRGDLSAFIQGYAEDCSFVGGSSVITGRNPVLARYKQRYSSRAAMGTLTFSGLEVHVVDPNVATVIGHFALARSTSAGGPASGIFSLVFRLKAGRWQIVLDHTS